MSEESAIEAGARATWEGRAGRPAMQAFRVGRFQLEHPMVPLLSGPEVLVIGESEAHARIVLVYYNLDGINAVLESLEPQDPALRTLQEQEPAMRALTMLVRDKPYTVYVFGTYEGRPELYRLNPDGSASLLEPPVSGVRCRCPECGR